MGKFDDLIKSYCPNGVQYVKLGDYCPVLRGKRLTKSQLSEEGRYKVFHGGIEPIGYYNISNRVANSTMIINVGASAGTVGYSKEDFWSSDGCFCLQHNASFNSQYIFYYLQSQEKYLKSRVRHAGIPTLDANVLNRMDIPLAPLPVQNTIVEFLDKFECYAAELQAELQARKEQYEYYRNQLLTRFTPEQQVREYSLGELGTIIRGNCLQKKDFSEDGVGCIHYGQIYTRYRTYATETFTYVPYDLAKKLLHVQPGNLVIACTSENVEDVCKCVAWLGEDEIVTGGHACVFRHNQNPKYIAYFFQTEYFFQQKKKYAYGAKVIDIKPDSIAKIRIPLPSLEEQNRIVNILDKFEALVNDLSQGLPAEIAAVQEQYEYYRNKLLTF